MLIRANHVIHVIEAGVSLDHDFLSGRPVVVLLLLGLGVCTFLFVLSAVKAEASCREKGFFLLLRKCAGICTRTR